MDLLNILLNPLKFKSTCFICFKQSNETLSLREKLFICDELSQVDTDLADIMKYLFPSHDILFGQACLDCTSSLLNTYVMLRKHDVKRDILSEITTSINDKLQLVKHEEHITTNLYVKLKLPIVNLAPEYAIQSKEEENTSKDICFDQENQFCHSINNQTVYEFCKKCDMTFVTKLLLNEHNKMVHKNVNTSAICEFCGKDCKKPATLKAHLNCHKEKTCPHCFKVLKSHSHYKVHVKNHEGNVVRKIRRSHYLCSICPFKSFNKNSLDAHVNKVHLRIRPFVCDVCDKGFYKKSNLTEHMLIHTKSKSLTCEQCGDSFATKKTLMEHLRLHNGEKPFQCEVCSLSFVTSGRRSDHFKRKHLEKSICCFLCDKKFSLKKELNGHMKKAHGQIGQSQLGEVAFIETNNLYGQTYLDKEVLLKL